MLEFIKEKWPELLLIALIGALWIAVTLFTYDPRQLVPAHQPRADVADSAAAGSLADLAQALAMHRGG
jgi:hypothetical protein